MSVSNTRLNQGPTGSSCSGIFWILVLMTPHSQHAILNYKHATAALKKTWIQLYTFILLRTRSFDCAFWICHIAIPLLSPALSKSVLQHDTCLEPGKLSLQQTNVKTQLQCQTSSLCPVAVTITHSWLRCNTVLGVAASVFSIVTPHVEAET